MKVLLCIAAVFLAVVTVEATLVDTLNIVHNNPAFKNLTHPEQLVLIELLAEAEVGELKTYINTIGFQTVLDVIDNLPEAEAHLLTQALITELNKESSSGGSTAVGRRDLVSALKYITTHDGFLQLSTVDQYMAEEIIRAAENHTLTQLVDRLGYAEILGLLDRLHQQEEHAFSVYLSKHLDKENHLASHGKN